MVSEIEPPFNAYEGDEPYLFVSYSHSDKGLVYPIIEDLYKKGVRIWYDEGIPAASNWIEQIADTIIDCNCFLVFITRRALKSEHVRDEISYAKRKKKKMFVIYLEDTELPSEIEFQIGSIQALYRHKMTKETFWKKIKSELTEVTSERKKKTSFEEIIDKENGRNLYVIITCSLQNDFIGRGYINEIISDNNDDFKVNYELCEEKWIEYFKDRKISNYELNVEEFIAWMKDEIRPTSQEILHSYHKFLEKYNHRVHVDYEQSERLWGNEKLKKFISDLMEKGFKAYKDEDSKEFYYFIHLRDFHRFTEEELEELKLFGPHCLMGTHGAKFIDPLNQYIEQYNQINIVINSNSLSSFVDTELNDALYNIMLDKSVSKEKIIIGIFGLMTNIKIPLLTYEFNLQYKFKNVYVCKDYCAGFDAKKHEEGLYQINNILQYTNVLNEKSFREVFNF